MNVMFSEQYNFQLTTPKVEDFNNLWYNPPFLFFMNWCKITLLYSITAVTAL